MTGDSLLEGLYEQLITAELQRRLQALVGVEIARVGVDRSEQPSLFARHAALALERALQATRDPAKRLQVLNAVLGLIGHDNDKLAADAQQLLRLGAPPRPGRPTVTTIRPATPLAEAALLTNAEGDPQLGHELRAELASADRVDLLCAFLMWPGLRLLDAELLALRERDVPLRVITTTYLGGTQQRAIDRLVRDYGAQVRIEYHAQRTRLHAKAWLFHRNTGFHTAYVGSSNLSQSAMLDGVEWNVRLSSVATPGLIRTFRATFDRYWNSPHYREYHPDRDGDDLAEALGRARTGGATRIDLSGLDVRAFPHQEVILERLDVERSVHNRHRNLVVSATGTGKTVVAALDYRRLCRTLPAAPHSRPSLLFVAHRKEILDQSLRTYREVLGDAGFGEVYYGGQRPQRWRHVFASVQSLSRQVCGIAPDAFQVLVVDEFHHAAAATYRDLLDHLRPTELLALTATPERGDGVDVRRYFDDHTAAELRLWEALEQDLLTPFHYYGIADGVDVSRVAWTRGRYDVEGLSRLYTGNDARARIVLSGVRDTVADPARMRALGFCVSVEHAGYMARVFTEAGLPAVAVTSAPGSTDRDQALQDLRQGRITTVFAVDMFNEGVDVPQIDTILLLRPTESPTVFLQQLGRGLRLAESKPVCTVLDFVGNQNANFRFDLRFRAITGATRSELTRQVERGFPFLPAGTQIVLDRQSQDTVLANLKARLGGTVSQLVAELRAHPTPDLATFLSRSGAELCDVIRSNRSWTDLRRRAGVPVADGGRWQERLLKRVRALAHVDDPDRANGYRLWLSGNAPRYDDAGQSEEQRAYGRMLFFSLWPDGGPFHNYAAGLEAVRAEPNVCADLRAVIDLGLEGAEHVATPLPDPLTGLPLRVHGRYTREELLTALGHAHLGERRPSTVREGVVWLPDLPADAFLVTVHKSEQDYSPTTMYRDYLISPQLLHWETQATTSVASATGQRYLHHEERASHVLLFCRERNTTAFGTGAPYLFLGVGRYVSHEGDRPIAITWRLDRPAPPGFGLVS